MHAARRGLGQRFAHHFAQDPHFAPHAGVAFERRAELGQGGMGVVYRVRDDRLGREAALKLLHGAPGEASLRRFRREAELTARLDHPGVPPVYEAGITAGGEHYMLMKVISGMPLEARIADQDHSARYDPRAYRELLEAVVRVGETVAYAHAQGIVHRDLKPANVMLGRFGEVLVLDWGLAKDVARGDEDDRFLSTVDEDAAREAGRTRVGSVLGTPGYMPPEQAEGASVGPPADVFGLGAILVAVLTGRPPVEGATTVNTLAATLGGKIALPRDRRPDVPAELHDIAASALAVDPQERSSASELVSDLQAHLAGGTVSVHRYTLPERVRRSAARHPTLLALASVGALGLVAVGAIVTQLTARAEAREAQIRRATHAGLVTRAQHDAENALAALKAAPSRDLEQRTALGIQALGVTARWLALAQDDAAARVRYETAIAVGTLAVERGQWPLAERAFAKASGLGVDDAEATRLLAQVEGTRSAAARKRRALVTSLLERAAAGKLEQELEGFDEAVFLLTRHAGQQTVELLANRLRTLTASLKAKRPLSAGERDLARLACEALGRIGIAARAEEAIGAYLAAVSDPDPAVPAGIALVRLGTPAAYRVVHVARRRFGIDGRFSNKVRRWMSPRVQLELRGTGERAYLQRGEERRAQGDLQGARADFSRAVELSPQSARAWAGRGATRILLKDLRGALHDLTQASTLGPPSSKVWNNLGEVRRRMGDLKGALAAFGRALEIDPKSATAHHDRAMTRTALRDLLGAKADYTRAIELDPKLADAWNNRGSVHLRLRDLSSAVRDYTQAIHLDPLKAGFWTNRGIARRRQRDAKGALADHTRAIELDPLLPNAWLNRAFVRRLQRDHAGAIRDCTQAIALDPKYARAWGSRANAFLALGRNGEALRDFEQCLKLAPNHPQAAKTRALIKRLRAKKHR